MPYMSESSASSAAATPPAQDHRERSRSSSREVREEKTEDAMSIDQDQDEAKTEQPEDQGDGQEGDDFEDEEGMDMKAKALTNLLKTSSVFVAIMAEKMRDQQAKQREEAQKRAKAKAAAEEERRKQEATKAAQSGASTPASASSGRATRASARTKRRSSDEDNQGETLKTKEKTPEQRAANKSKTDITSYLDTADLNIPQNNESVQAALAKAADEYEQKPTALGEQELVATQQPALVKGARMREYQLEGLEWLKSLWMNGLCGILADEMGLGKTVQAISLIAFFKEHKISGPFLIAAPLSTVSNWVDEFAFWTPDVRAVLYHGSKAERADIRATQMRLQDQRKWSFPVVCTSYEVVMNDRKFLSKYQWKYIIVDEGHRLKNFNCRLIKELLTYQSANRLLLTGTPLQNNIAELWSLLHFLLPDIFNDLNSFESWFDFSSVLEARGHAGAVERRKSNLVSTMHAILKPFLLRRVKTDVETSLPKKREYILYAPLTPEQKDLYLEILNGTSRNYLERRAVERIEKRNKRPETRAQKLKRTASESGASTPTGSVSPRSGSATPRSGKRQKMSYREMSDREFNKRCHMLDRGEDVSLMDEWEEEEPSESGLIEIEKAKTMALAKKEISTKKLQNPIMQARLACNSPHNFYWPWTPQPHEPDGAYRVDHTLVTSSGKMLLLDRLVPRLMSKGHKLLIFSQFKTQLDILQDWAQQLHGWNVCRIDGGVSQSERRQLIAAFNKDPSYKLFLLSTRAGGQGINLTAADTVILFDSDWNPQQDLQAQDRAHRIGQTRPVIVYRLATRGTVEQTLLEKADGKRRLERLVIQKGKFKGLLDQDKGAGQGEAEEVRRAMGGDERFEVLDVGDREGANAEMLLSDRDLETITDRSDEAYERAEKGEEEAGTAVRVVETKKNADTVLGVGA